MCIEINSIFDNFKLKKKENEMRINFNNWVKFIFYFIKFKIFVKN